ncbi:MAG: CCA tRNA nucleotidyltransferase [Hyphomicrobiales bacterium]|nr:CCA tRNA nucleotidyltransferase [Hyphomicrobiales bacterium]
MTSAKTEPLNDLRNGEWLSWPETQRVFEALGAEGNTVRAVGGVVRNTLLGRPINDVDLASDASPETVIALAEKAGLKVVSTGLDHGTVTVIAGHLPIEVTTLRKDVETFGRRAKVAFTDDWDADARRRDFTINALYMNLDGTVFDPLDGMADIKACRVRFIGDPNARISEDYLRILRFFRFLADLNSTDMDADDLRACVRGRAGLETLSGERVHAELSKLLVAEGVVPALTAMFDNGLLVMLLSGVARLPRLERLIGLEAGLDLEPDAMRRLAALAVMISEDAERLATRFKLSKAEYARLSNAARYREFTLRTGENTAKAWLYREGTGAFRDAVLLAWADSGAEADQPRWRDLYALPERWQVPEFPLKGSDIVELGVAAGPRVGSILKSLEDSWIAGGFSAGQADLLAIARTLVPGAS